MKIIESFSEGIICIIMQLYKWLVILNLHKVFINVIY